MISLVTDQTMFVYGPSNMCKEIYPLFFKGGIKTTRNTLDDFTYRVSGESQEVTIAIKKLIVSKKTHLTIDQQFSSNQYICKE